MRRSLECFTCLAMVLGVASAFASTVAAEERTPEPLTVAPEMSRTGVATKAQAQSFVSPIPVVAPTQMLVRFRDDFPVCVATAFALKGSAPELDQLFERAGVVAVEPVAQRQEVERGKARTEPLPLSKLLLDEAVHLGAMARARGLDPEAVGPEAPHLFHLYRLRLEPGRDVAAIAKQWRDDPRVDFAEPNGRFFVNALPQDPYIDPDGDGAWQSGSWGESYADLWGLESSGWTQVWERRSEIWTDPEKVGGGGVVVAVIDTGVDFDHPDLAANVWRDGAGNPGRDFVDIDLQSYLDAGFVAVVGEDYSGEDGDPADRRGHGTHVAGTIAAVADNGAGLAGVAWGASLMPVRAGFALGFSGGGEVGALEFDDITTALIWAVDQGAQVINMSFGGTESSSAVSMALDLAAALDVVLISSAGNADFETSIFFPANHPRVVAVGALKPDDQRAWFSNHGSDIDLTAPGRDVLSLRAQGTLLTGVDSVVGERYIRSTGTSMAAPHIAGAAALVWSRRPELSASEVVGALRAGGTPHPLFTDGPGIGEAIAFGNRLDLEASLEVPSGPHAVIESYSVDHRSLSSGGNDANGVASPGETVPWLIVPRNVLDTAAGVSVTVVTEDPWLTVETPTQFLDRWSHGALRAFEITVSVSADVPKRHRASFRIELRGEGYTQDIELSLEVHAPVTRLVETDVTDVLHLDAEAASDSRGNVVAVWNSFIFSANTNEILGRLLAADGTSLGETFSVWRDPVGRTARASVARDAEGRFAVSWTTQGGGDARVQSRLFAADGTPVGSVFTPSGPLSERSEVAMLAGGGYVVGWDQLFDDLIGAAIYDAQGLPISGVVAVAANTGGSASDVALAPLGDGFIAVWRFFRSFERSIHVMGRVFDGVGRPLGDAFQISETPSFFNTSPEITAGPGGFAVAWEACTPQQQRCGVRARLLDPQGTPRGSEIVLGPLEALTGYTVRVTSDGVGGYAASWDGCLPGFLVTGCRLFLRHFSASGEPAEPIYLKEKYLDDLLDPAVTFMSEGDLALLWDANRRDGSVVGDRGIFLQRVAPAASDSPSPPTGCSPADPSRLCLLNDRFRVTAQWRDFEGNIGSGTAIPVTNETGAFWFFSESNIETVVKVLDGRLLTGAYWVFYGALSNVEYTLTVTDTETGAVKVYSNPPGRFASVGDTFAFPVLPGG